MALERYFGIRHGYFYMLHFSPQRARFVIRALIFKLKKPFCNFLYSVQNGITESVACGYYFLGPSYLWVWPVRYSISGNLVLPQPSSGKRNRCSLFDYIRCPQLTSYWCYDHMQHWSAM